MMMITIQKRMTQNLCLVSISLKGGAMDMDFFSTRACLDKDKIGSAVKKIGVPPGTVCNYCKKEGHWKKECPELAKKK